MRAGFGCRWNVVEFGREDSLVHDRGQDVFIRNSQLQGGGALFVGATCCESGYTCTYANEFYSHSSECSLAYAQCGGALFIGATCCQSGYTCTYANDFYSQCVPDSDAQSSTSSTLGPHDPSTTVYSTTALVDATSIRTTSAYAQPTTATANPTSYQAQTTTQPVVVSFVSSLIGDITSAIGIGSSSCISAYSGQVGVAESCCSGLTCTEENGLFSQCLPVSTSTSAQAQQGTSTQAPQQTSSTSISYVGPLITTSSTGGNGGNLLPSSTFATSSISRAGASSSQPISTTLLAETTSIGSGLAQVTATSTTSSPLPTTAPAGTGLDVEADQTTTSQTTFLSTSVGNATSTITTLDASGHLTTLLSTYATTRTTEVTTAAQRTTGSSGVDAAADSTTVPVILSGGSTITGTSSASEPTVVYETTTQADGHVTVVGITLGGDSTSNTKASGGSSKKSGTNYGAIVGGVVGAAVLIIILTPIILICSRRMKARRYAAVNEKSGFGEEHIGAREAAGYGTGMVFQGGRVIDPTVAGGGSLRTGSADGTAERGRLYSRLSIDGDDDANADPFRDVHAVGATTGGGGGGMVGGPVGRGPLGARMVDSQEDVTRGDNGTFGHPDRADTSTSLSTSSAGPVAPPLPSIVALATSSNDHTPKTLFEPNETVSRGYDLDEGPDDSTPLVAEPLNLPTAPDAPKPKISRGAPSPFFSAADTRRDRL
ncbi:hypothetical protein MNV49_002444 [Pseudohyphozyma bogoriensis]|nr:hypothetical protein MNV49_002444 [Pseudohyphozyma bogoriensis]